MVVVECQCRGNINVENFLVPFASYGDDIDLIPSTKGSCRFVVGIERYQTYTLMMQNYELSTAQKFRKDRRCNLCTLVDPPPMEQLPTGRPSLRRYCLTITFVDSSDGVINAQDTRCNGSAAKTAFDDEILALNVNSDSRINTFDALGIVEAFVDDSEYLIVTKAASLTTNN